MQYRLFLEDRHVYEFFINYRILTWYPQGSAANPFSCLPGSHVLGWQVFDDLRSDHALVNGHHIRIRSTLTIPTWALIFPVPFHAANSACRGSNPLRKTLTSFLEAFSFLCFAFTLLLHHGSARSHVHELDLGSWLSPDRLRMPWTVQVIPDIAELCVLQTPGLSKALSSPSSIGAASSIISSSPM